METVSSDVAYQLNFVKKADSLWSFQKPGDVISGFVQPQKSQAKTSFSLKMKHLYFLQMGFPQTGPTSHRPYASIYQENTVEC